MSTSFGRIVRPCVVGILMLSVFLALPLGCNHTEFCCLEYERGTPEQSYCNSHSRAAGHFLLDAEEVSGDSLNAAISALERLADAANGCGTIDCVEDVISGDPGLEGLWRSYQEEHSHADSVLAADGIEFDESERIDLIRCGFVDAAERTRKNIEEGR